MTFLDITPGDSPLILAFPHGGTDLPPEVAASLNASGLARADTDWHIARLYDGLAPAATRIATRIHRYAIDVNRPPGDDSLYPGQNTTGLCPLTDFDGQPICDTAPDAAEIACRTALWHAPYHAALAAEIARVRARHGHAILYDCHSIRSRIPFLFDGRLPDLNLGTDGGRTAAPGIEAATAALCAAPGFTHVVNGRFRGGWTTRHYGRPGDGIHALQMEIAQSTYLAAEAPPWTFDPARAAPLRAVLARILDTLTAWRPA